MKASDNIFPKVSFLVGSAPATPASGNLAIYAKTGGGVFAKDSAGTETALGGGSGGMTNPMTAAGDIIIGGTSGTPTALPKATDGQVLTLVSGAPAWAASSGSSSLGSAVTALSIASGVVAIDCSLGDYFTLPLTANVTSITFSNLPASGQARTLLVRMKQDATGSRTVALPSAFKAITGSDTVVQSAANAYTVLAISTVDQGTRWEYSMKAGAA
jgi:hypothetical protein